MNSTAVKTLLSRQRFPEDPQDLVALTNKQHAAFKSIRSSMQLFLGNLTSTTNHCHQMLDNMLQCLDLSWDTTGQMDSSIAGMINSMKDITNQMHQTLPIPLKEQMDRHKSVQSQINRWKSQSSRLDQKLKEFDRVQTKSKNQTKKDKAKYSAEDAVLTCQEEAVALKPCLVQLNVEGVRACCQMWQTLSHSFNRFCTELQPYLDQLNRQATILNNQAGSGDLPAWTETTRHRGTKVRLSTLSALTSYADSNTGSPHSIRSSTLAEMNGVSSIDKRGTSQNTDHYYAQPSSTEIPSTWTKYTSEQPEYSRSYYSASTRPMTMRTNYNRKNAMIATRRYHSSEAYYPEQSMVSLRSNSAMEIVPEIHSSQQQQARPHETDEYSQNRRMRRSRSTEPISNLMERTIECGPRTLLATDSTEMTPCATAPTTVLMSYERHPSQNLTNGTTSSPEENKRESIVSNYSIEYEMVTATPYRKTPGSPSAKSDETIRGDRSMKVEL